jgi:uncharacterized protein (DUF305 family)
VTTNPLRPHVPWLVALATAGCTAGHGAMRMDPHQGMAHGAMAPEPPEGPFVVSKDRAFQALMDEAMVRMHAGMDGAPRTGDPDRDFILQMIPHHQGAIDMARVLLLYGQDPGLRRLAREILTDQQSEIDLMRAWLDAHPGPSTPKKENP